MWVRLFQKAWFVTNPTRRFLVYAVFATGAIVYWFMTMSQSDFPTGEVQYAVMPALLHPYRFAWEAPYSIFWYMTQWAVIDMFLPVVQLFSPLFHLSCPNNCVTQIHYINGTVTGYPFEKGFFQYQMGLSWMIGMAIINFAFLFYLRKSELMMPFFMSSLWFWATTPVNLTVLWAIVILGYRFPAALPLAIIYKLPFGAPGEVWRFALGSGSVIGHFFPYIMLGFWYVSLTVHWIDRDRRFPWLGRFWRVIRDYE